MMRHQIFSESEWIYPDTPLKEEGTAEISLPLNGHAGFQILGETVSCGEHIRISLEWDGPQGPAAEFFELLPVCVNANTDSEFMTTSDYSRCKDFVSRQAPFGVYDGLQPLSASLRGPRLALYIRLSSARCLPGKFTGNLRIMLDGEALELTVGCQVYPARIPDIRKATLGMLNFFCYENLTEQHGAAEDSAAYWDWFRKYVRAQLDMRCTHILLPAGEEIRRRDGTISRFNFSRAEKAATIAFEEGAPYICGAHIAHWHEWNESEYYLQWDSEVSTLSQEGYLQMKEYFLTWAKVLRRNGWMGRVAQALADEPQVHNDTAYRAMACVFRKFLPGVPIIDAVETTNLGGAVDVWVPKQDTYEKNKEEFDRLQAAGETLWFYTCAFPAGRIMNRSMDLPLAVSRLLLWMGFSYGLTGYLHWGFNYYIGGDIWKSACCPHKGKLLPAGDAHVVYPGTDTVLPSLRFEAQRGGAEDYELFRQLARHNPVCARELVSRACASFREYTSNAALIEEIRKELLMELSEGDSSAGG